MLYRHRPFLLLSMRYNVPIGSNSYIPAFDYRCCRISLNCFCNHFQHLTNTILFSQSNGRNQSLGTIGQLQGKGSSKTG